MRRILCVFLGLIAAQPALAAPPGASLAKDLARQLDRRPIILLGEHHGSVRYHAMRQALLRDRNLLCRIDDVVIESGSSLHQSIADRFVAGRPVARSEKVRIWRDTTQWLVWDSPVYERILDAVREANLGKRCSHPLRVVLAEPPIPWADVRNAADYRKYGERDQSYADIIEREVLAKGRRALMVVGGLHVHKRGAEGVAGRPMVASLLESKFPGRILSIDTVSDPKVAAMMGLRENRLTMVHGTAAGRMSFVTLAPNASAKVTVNGETQWKPLKELSWPPVQDVVDGFLFLGPDASTVEADPSIYREPAYQAELRRRAVILKDVYGLDFLPDLEALIATSKPGA
jgi:hypothetical protein